MKVLKDVLLSGIIITMIYFCLTPWGWTFEKTIGTSMVITIPISFLVGIYEELVKLNKK